MSKHHPRAKPVEDWYDSLSMYQLEEARRHLARFPTDHIGGNQSCEWAVLVRRAGDHLLVSWNSKMFFMSEAGGTAPQVNETLRELHAQEGADQWCQDPNAWATLKFTNPLDLNGLRKVIDATRTSAPCWLAYVNEFTGEAVYGGLNHKALRDFIEMLRFSNHEDLLQKQFERTGPDPDPFASPKRRPDDRHELREFLSRAKNVRA